MTSLGPFARAVRPLALTAVLLIIATSCSEAEDSSYWNETMNLSTGDFEYRFVESQSVARDVSIATVQQNWIDGASGSTLDSSAAKYNAWHDWSTDSCSNGPDTGPHFDFKQACARHDWGWRNLKRIDQHWNCPDSSGHPDPDLAVWCGSWPVFGSRGEPIGSVGNLSNGYTRQLVHNVFLSDMQEDCAPRNFISKPACQTQAGAYYTIVFEAT